MPDSFTREERSTVMSRVKGRDTQPERLVRQLLHSMGYRFRLQCKELPGTPDIVLPRHRKIVMVHGCFWHGHDACRRAARPSSNVEFWDRKLDANKARDQEALRKLSVLGWDVLVVWQCELRDTSNLRIRLHRFMTSHEEGVIG